MTSLYCYRCGEYVPDGTRACPRCGCVAFVRGGRIRRSMLEPGDPTEPAAEATYPGCGASLEKFDVSGRPRTYVTGHNQQPREARNAILGALSVGPLHRSQIATIVGKGIQATACALSALRREGKVRILGAGSWGLA